MFLKDNSSSQAATSFCLTLVLSLIKRAGSPAWGVGAWAGREHLCRRAAWLRGGSQSRGREDLGRRAVQRQVSEPQRGKEGIRVGGLPTSEAGILAEVSGV